MAFDPVPWFVGGGAQHSADVARLLMYLATGGSEGVVNRTDMRVLALAVPGGNVRVMPGACVILNRALGGANQSYGGRIAQEDDTVAIAATGSSGGRSDLIIARVEDPTISGEPWQTPDPVETGPYIYPRVIANVPSGTRSVHELGLGYSAITLARVDIPASTGAITQAMIKDLRPICNVVTGPEPPPGGEPEPDPENPPDPDNPPNQPESPTCVVVIPSTGGPTAGNLLSWLIQIFTNWPIVSAWNVNIPPWSTHADIDVKLSGIQVNNADAYGEARLIVDGAEAVKITFDLDLPSTSKPCRQTVQIAGRWTVPVALRGKRVQMRVQTRFFDNSRNTNCVLRANEATYTCGTITFRQLATLT